MTDNNDHDLRLRLLCIYICIYVFLLAAREEVYAEW